jgi:hypothetical protein
MCWTVGYTNMSGPQPDSQTDECVGHLVTLNMSGPQADSQTDECVGQLATLTCLGLKQIYKQMQLVTPTCLGLKQIHYMKVLYSNISGPQADSQTDECVGQLVTLD